MKALGRLSYLLLAWVWLVCTVSAVHAADTLTWRAKENRVDADITDWPLPTLLSKIARASGWRVFVEPGTTYTVSTKFKNATTDEALHRFLGKVNFAVTTTNGASELYVYRTDPRAATQQVHAEKAEVAAKNYIIPNELIVRLKKGAKLTIDELAKMTGAKILGRDDAQRVYRLQFETEAAKKLAEALLNRNEDVAWTDNNYKVDKPSPANMTASTSGTTFNVNPTKSADGSHVVGLIDTAVQPQKGFENYLLKQINVAGDPAPASDTITHGTAMLETMLNSMGDSPSKVLPVNVYPGNGEETTTYEVLQGVLKAIEAGANPINMSLGGTGDSEALHQLIKQASQNGVVFIAAAGNEPGKQLTFPAAWPEVIAITASDPAGNLAPYANSGDFVAGMAPGTAIVSLNGQQWMVEGTSVSTAVISGMLSAKATSTQATPTTTMAQQILANFPMKR